MFSSVTNRHTVQQVCIAHILSSFKLSSPDHCFVDFGAGKGKLTRSVQQTLFPDRVPSFVLVDRKNFRLKAERYLHYSNVSEEAASSEPPESSSTSCAARIQIDIKDLCLSEVAQTKGRRIVAMSKHLCGAATDLSLRCLADFEETQRKIKSALSESGRESSPQEEPVAGIAFALCCHHRCSWEAYVGKQWMLRHGIGSKEFSSLCSFSSWAICGTREAASSDDLAPDPIGASRLDTASREQLGYRIKRFIDYGRVEYLRERGYDVQLVEYTTREMSPENVALVATPRGKPA